MQCLRKERCGMTAKARPPIGIEDFEEIRTGGYYYVDKTGLIRTLLNNFGKVNLFTRPRRFGKTLNMSMLKYFFEIGSKALFLTDWQSQRKKSFVNSTRGNIRSFPSV